MERSPLWAQPRPINNGANTLNYLNRTIYDKEKPSILNPWSYIQYNLNYNKFKDTYDFLCLIYATMTINGFVFNNSDVNLIKSKHFINFIKSRGIPGGSTYNMIVKALQYLFNYGPHFASPTGQPYTLDIIFDNILHDFVFTTFLNDLITNQRIYNIGSITNQPTGSIQISGSLGIIQREDLLHHQENIVRQEQINKNKNKLPRHIAITFIHEKCCICSEQLTEKTIEGSSCGHFYCAACFSKINKCAICRTLL